MTATMLHHPPRQLFPKSQDAGVKACTHTHPLSELWLFAWASAISKPGQSNIPQRRKPREEEICATTHLCRAQIGTNQMPPHWMLPTPLKHTITGLFLLFLLLSRQLKWLRKVTFFFYPLRPIPPLQPALISQMRWAASRLIGGIWAVWRGAVVMLWWGLNRILRIARSVVFTESAPSCSHLSCPCTMIHL